MRVLVTGSRTLTDELIVSATLRGLWHSTQNEFVVIEGGANGADALARRWVEGFRPARFYGDIGVLGAEQ